MSSAPWAECGLYLQCWNLCTVCNEKMASSKGDAASSRERCAMMWACTCKYGQCRLLDFKGMLWIVSEIAMIVLLIGHM